MLPINMVSTIITTMVGIQKSLKGAKQIENKRINAAKPAVLATVLINAVISVGDPSYTSGVQKWNGATPILKQNPINIRIIPL